MVEEQNEERAKGEEQNVSDQNNKSIEDYLIDAHDWPEWTLGNTQQEVLSRIDNEPAIEINIGPVTFDSIRIDSSVRECTPEMFEPVHDQNSRIRLDSSIRESSPDMFDSQNGESPVPLDEQEFANIFDDINDNPNDNSIERMINSAEFLIVSDSPLTQNVMNERQEVTTNSPGSVEANSGSRIETFSCYLCSFMTNCSKQFDNHILASHNKLCNQCDYATTSDELQKAHEKLKHNVQCDSCEFKATSISSMEDHKKTAHTDREETRVAGNGLKRNITDRDMDGQVKRTRICSIDEVQFGNNEENNAIKDAYIAKRKDIATEIETVEEVQTGSNEENYAMEEEPCATNDEANTIGIETHVFKNNEFDASGIIEKDLSELDENNGNVAFIISNYKSKKKPAFSRKVINWKPAQTQRYKTTMYSCLGYYECDECKKKSRTSKICKTCNIPYAEKICNSKKYVYFCENKCVREIYKTCCEEEPNERKLVILFTNKHSCIMNVKSDSPNALKYKKVESLEDIMVNIAGCEENKKFPVENVLRVPNDVNGDKIYVLENTDNKELKEIIRDGRKWQIYTQTTSQTLSHILGEYKSKKVRKYRCNDQFFCYSPQCPFKKRFEIVNQVNWNLEDGKRRCVSCSEEMELLQCNASKFVAISANNKFVLIKHMGTHKCIAKTTLESQILEEIEGFFEKNPTATRSEAIVHHLVNKINFGSKQDVIDLISVSLNIWEINNCKQKGIKRLNPHGSKMEAIRHLKKKLEDIGNPFEIILKIYDDVYICSSCNFISEQTEGQDCVKICVACSMIPMDHVGPSVFISSKESLATMRELQVGGSLETEACCLDHQPSRLRAYTTFAAYAYDLDFRRMRHCLPAL